MTAKISHYYGDTVRKLFLAIGVVMLVALPFFSSSLPGPALIAFLGVLVVAVVAGLTNPKQIWVMGLNVGVSLAGLAVFEYYAILQAKTDPVWLFVINQAIALLFFFALYYSVKTLRGWAVPEEDSGRGGEPPTTTISDQSGFLDDHTPGASGMMK